MSSVMAKNFFMGKNNSLKFPLIWEFKENF